MKKESKGDGSRRWAVRLFGKAVPVWLLAVIIAGGLGSAALLTYYGVIETNVTVQQSILLDAQALPGSSSITDSIVETAPGGETFCFKHVLENKMSVEGNVSLVNECHFNYTTDCAGVTTSYYQLGPSTTLVLENKDAGFHVINDNIGGVLTFDTVNPSFDYAINVTGLSATTQYAIIYYADPWAGNHPGAVIDTFTTLGDGSFSGADNVNLEMNLPSLPDENIAKVPDFCAFHNGIDNYTNCHGAKIWVVPTADLTGGNSLPMIAFDRAEYLFEMDLIVYLDCSTPVDQHFTTLVGDPVTSITIPSDGSKDLLVCYAFDEAVMPGNYNITTRIVP
ncbi:MAG: hypothetical protein V1645_03085 [archaeon]